MTKGRTGIDERAIVEAALHKLHDCSDVLRALSVASKLLADQIEYLEVDILELARLAADKD
jgi:hypothetical protein